MRDAIRSLVRTAMGKEAADLALTNARLINVYTGEVMPGCAVGIRGEKIAYISFDGQLPGEAAEVLDARGMYLAPGLIDGHTHIDSMCPVHEYLRYAVPGGTTCIITETTMVAKALGYQGVLWFLEALRDQPIKLYALAPPVTPANASEEGYRPLSREELEGLLELPEVLGLGEVYWPRVTAEEDGLYELLEMAAARRKTLEGHSAGARRNKLCAYLAAGFTSCHEPITADQVAERLRLGVWTMIREGSIRRELEGTAGISRSGLSLDRVCLVSDGVDPAELRRYGYMEHVVNRAIGLGYDPVTAIRMASLNVAAHFGLDGHIGGIAPGRYADMMLLPEADRVKPAVMMSSGRVVARDGTLLEEPREFRYPPGAYGSLAHLGKVSPEDVRVYPPGGREAEVRVIELVSDMITGEARAVLPCTGDGLSPDPGSAIQKLVLLDRKGGSGPVVGFVWGFGAAEGAFATSLSWEGNHLVAIGSGDLEICGALNRLLELGGGFVLWEDGGPLEELPMPVGGIIPELTLEEVADRLENLDKLLKGRGYRHNNPVLASQVLTFVALPSLRITPRGLYAVRENSIVPLFP